MAAMMLVSSPPERRMESPGAFTTAPEIMLRRSCTFLANSESRDKSESKIFRIQNRLGGSTGWIPRGSRTAVCPCKNLGIVQYRQLIRADWGGLPRRCRVAGKIRPEPPVDGRIISDAVYPRYKMRAILAAGRIQVPASCNKRGSVKIGTRCDFGIVIPVPSPVS